MTVVIVVYTDTVANSVSVACAAVMLMCSLQLAKRTRLTQAFKRKMEFDVFD